VLPPDLTGGAYSDPSAVFRGLLLKGVERREGEGSEGVRPLSYAEKRKPAPMLTVAKIIVP